MALFSDKLLIVLVTLITATGCRSSARNQQPADYGPYFRTVKFALEQTASEDFSGALNTYRQLFRRYSFVFPRDVFNALQLAIQTGNKGARDSLVIRGAESGVRRKTFLQNPRVRDAFLPQDSLLFERLFTAGYSIWITRADTALRREMVSRYNYEQASKGGPEYRSICTDNFQRIAALAKAGRFPGEQRIGVNDELENCYAFATLKHYPFSYKMLQHELRAAMLKGQAQPLSLVCIYGFNQSLTSELYRPGTQPDTVTFAKIYNTGFSWHSSDTAAVDRARAEMFLVSLETQAELKRVARKYGMAIDLGW